MSRSAPMSIEVGHMYLDRMDSKKIEIEAEAAARWIGRVVRPERVESSSVVVLLDNYNRFSNPLEWELEEAQQAVVDGFLQKGVRLDYVVAEKSLAATVHNMFQFLVPAPRCGDGSTQGSSLPPLWQKETGWLSNGDPCRPDAIQNGGGLLVGDMKDEPIKSLSATPARHRRSISLDVQLWTDSDSGRLWACPALAAWWQLIRMGALQHMEDATASVPSMTWSRPDAPPLHALRTLTLLKTEYIEVEHAVWNILRQIALPDNWVRALRESGEQPPSRAHLDRMTYIFAPDQRILD